MFHRIKNTNKLVNLRNVTTIILNNKTICYQLNCTYGLGSILVSFLDPAYIFHTYDSREEAKNEFESIHKKVAELK